MEPFSKEITQSEKEILRQQHFQYSTLPLSENDEEMRERFYVFASSDDTIDNMVERFNKMSCPDDEVVTRYYFYLTFADSRETEFNVSFTPNKELKRYDGTAYGVFIGTVGLSFDPSKFFEKLFSEKLYCDRDAFFGEENEDQYLLYNRIESFRYKKSTLGQEFIDIVIAHDKYDPFHHRHTIYICIRNLIARLKELCLTEQPTN